MTPAAGDAGEPQGDKRPRCVASASQGYKESRGAADARPQTYTENRGRGVAGDELQLP